MQIIPKTHKSRQVAFRTNDKFDDNRNSLCKEKIDPYLHEKVYCPFNKTCISHKYKYFKKTDMLPF